MAPISGVVGIDDDQRFALMKFRKSVRDVLKPEHDDHFLLRWLRARQWNPEAAEQMLRDSLAWREKYGMDTTLATWQAPEVLTAHFPSGSTGFDKEGSPVIIIPFVGLDVWGLLHSVTKSDVLRLVLRHLENYLSTARKQAELHGEAALKVVVIFDMEGWSMRQYAWRPAAEMVFSLLKTYEANYPEILKTCFIINAPKVFSLAFNVVKKFMHEYTISKIKIFSSDPKKWKSAILYVVPADQLPQHYGGTMVDANGDPRCGLIVKPGGKVPKNFYRKISPEKDREFKRVSIKSGDRVSVDLLCADQESILKWELGVESLDIQFLIKCRNEEGQETTVHGPTKVKEGNVETGFLPVTGPATYSVVFDNKDAKHKSKVYYDILITDPSRDLNINDSLEEGGATAL